MNQNPKKHTMKEAFLAGLSQMIVLVGGILVFFAIYKFHTILSAIESLCVMLMPIILGVVFAYLIHPIVDFIEDLLDQFWDKIKKTPGEKRRGSRLPAILITFLLVGWVIYLLISLVVPELYSNITRIIYAVPAQMTKYYYQLIDMMSANSWLTEVVNNIYKSVMEFVTGWVKNEMFSQISVIISGVFGVVGAVSNVLIGCIVTIYILLSKETFFRQFNLVLHAFFSEKTVDAIKEILHESNQIFGGFISGKILDSLIIGILCFIGASILHLPYVVLVSVIIGVTNVIPFFGPYIGAIPCALLILLDSPTKGLIFIVFILILQQFDGNILGPKILGDSTGLSPFWVIFAILLGSGLFGIVGMIIGVPLFGVIYYLIRRYLHYRLKQKEYAIDPPADMPEEGKHIEESADR